MSTGGIDADEVVVAPFGHVYVAPVGSTLPTDVTTALTSAWADLGYIDEDGVSITPSGDTTDIGAWQTGAPVKVIQTTSGLELQFKMEQINQATTGLYLFGDDWTGNVSNIASLILATDPPLNEVALVVEWEDSNDNNNRLLIPRGVVTDREAIQLVRTDAVKLGVTFRCLDSSGTLATWLSNDTNLLPAS